MKRPPIAPKGASEYQTPFRAPHDLGEKIVRSARKLGVSVVEWLRQAAKEKLDRQEQGRR